MAGTGLALAWGTNGVDSNSRKSPWRGLPTWNALILSVKKSRQPTIRP